jgi:Smr domain
MQLCHICGNEISPALLRCPYCESAQDSKEGDVSTTTMFIRKTVNLEQGFPTVEQALQRLEGEISAARLERVRLVTLIHGYGSSGKGGAIRQECRKKLDYLCRRGEIKGFIPGEEFSRRQGTTKQLLSRFPQLSDHPHLNRHNKGITIVVLF